MIQSASPLVQALLGTLFTWGLTALGASMVFLVPKDLSEIKERKLLDAALGFASGVMIAASFWSLLTPAIDSAVASGSYGAHGEWAFVPVAIGFILGAFFVFISDHYFPEDVVHHISRAQIPLPPPEDIRLDEEEVAGAVSNSNATLTAQHLEQEQLIKASTKRIMLLVLAVTLHNFPEGMAVGVAFGSIGKSESSTFASARNLAIGVGLQNIPEGLAVSLPLLRLNYSRKKAFFWGQLSGLVEPIGGVLGAVALLAMEPLLPYALSFAAGAMIFVVGDGMIPEAHEKNPRISTLSLIFGFAVMMSMDVGLG